MADFDDVDPTAEDEFENDDEEMEDANEPEQDGDGDADQDEDEDEEDQEDDDNDDDDEDETEEKEQAESPSRGSGPEQQHASPSQDKNQANPEVVLTGPSPRQRESRSPQTGVAASWIPPTRPEALTALTYDIVPTMAAPQSTSINAITATLDMRWVFSGGADGYVRMYNWIETANGKVPLTVAQKHPFVDSVWKAGSLHTYWENEEPGALRTPGRGNDEGKWISPVYSLAVHRQALWLLSGLESGSINLQTCRHEAGTRLHMLKEHSSAVSVLTLSQDETSVLSGSWDKTIHDWDLNTGKVKRSFYGSGSQIGAVEVRPMSDVPVPEVSETQPEFLNDTFSSNNADRPLANGTLPNGPASSAIGGDEDAAGSPDGSLFGENDHGSLFGEDNAAGGGNAFGDDDDELTRALANGLQETDQDAPGDEDAEMGGLGTGGPVQPPQSLAEASAPDASSGLHDGSTASQQADGEHQSSQATSADAPVSLTNGLPHSDEPLTAPPTNEDLAQQVTSAADLPPQSESVFLSAAIDGSLRIWDRRIQNPVATILPYGGTPPWCTGACWSPSGNFFYAGRRNNTVEEYSIHHLSAKRSEPNRQFKFQAGSGPVYALKAMPNGRHLVCASQDILRIYDLQHSMAEGRNRSTVPFTIVPGHRGGVISALHVDPTCRFMLSAAGNRGWEGGGTEVLLGYEIGVQDAQGVWHR